MVGIETHFTAFHAYALRTVSAHAHCAQFTLMRTAHSLHSCAQFTLMRTAHSLRSCALRTIYAHASEHKHNQDGDSL